MTYELKLELRLLQMKLKTISESGELSLDEVDFLWEAERAIDNACIDIRDIN